jgi:hypothetical protein
MKREILSEYAKEELEDKEIVVIGEFNKKCWGKLYDI